MIIPLHPSRTSAQCLCRRSAPPRRVINDIAAAVGLTGTAKTKVQSLKALFMNQLRKATISTHRRLRPASPHIVNPQNTKLRRAVPFVLLAEPARSLKHTASPNVTGILTRHPSASPPPCVRGRNNSRTPEIHQMQCAPQPSRAVA